MWLYWTIIKWQNILMRENSRETSQFVSALLMIKVGIVQDCRGDDFFSEIERQAGRSRPNVQAILKKSLPHMQMPARKLIYEKNEHFSQGALSWIPLKDLGLFQEAAIQVESQAALAHFLSSRSTNTVGRTISKPSSKPSHHFHPNNLPSLLYYITGR